LRRAIDLLKRSLRAISGASNPTDGYVGHHDPRRLTTGRHSYGDPRIVTYIENGDGRVEIGTFCSIAYGVQFLLDGAHRIELITTSPLHSLGYPGPAGHGAGKGNIIVGHDVWIGREAKILSGVTIGTGAVIGSYSVVAKDVRPYAIVVGNPAREVRRRFSDEDCETLLRSRWWEWPDDRIREAHLDLWTSDVQAFANRWLRP
jgi:acetyltransferase-like isoleucine patch superfamily enzyme